MREFIFLADKHGKLFTCPHWQGGGLDGGYCVTCMTELLEGWYEGN